MNLNTNKIEDNAYNLNTLVNKKGAESIQILNEIDFLITNASTLPLTSKVMVDAEYLFSLTEKFRQVFPGELEQSELVIREVQRIVEEAESKAESIIQNAEAQAKSILNESRILKEAQAKSSMLVNDAMLVRNEMQKEAELFVNALFSDAEQQLLSSVQAVRAAAKSMNEPNA